MGKISYGTARNIVNLGALGIAVTLLLLWHQHTKSVHMNNAVFVSISSYRDRECAATVLDMFRKSQDWTRVYAGIVAYTMPGNKTAAEDCECPELAPFERNIQRIKLNFTEAKGPTVARLMAADLMKGQAYFLNVSVLLFKSGALPTSGREMGKL